MYHQFELDRIANVQRRYDPEFDIIRGAPDVTYVDNVLLELVAELIKETQELRAEIESLRATLDNQEAA